MALPLGVFDPTLVIAAWFDSALMLDGWFDHDMIGAPAATMTAPAGAAGAQGAFAPLGGW